MATRDYHTFYSTPGLWKVPNPTHNYLEAAVGEANGRTHAATLTEIIEWDAVSPTIIAAVTEDQPETIQFFHRPRKFRGGGNLQDNMVWVAGNSEDEAHFTALPDNLFARTIQIKDYLPDKELLVLTEHKRADVKWRAHPNYKGGGSWRDWVLVDWGPDGVLPANIWCFLDLTSLNSATKPVRYGGIDVKAGTCAVVECGKYGVDEEENAKSDIFKPMTLEIEGVERDDNGRLSVLRKFYLADCDAFSGACSVVPDFGGDLNAYFMVQPRREWKENFTKRVKEPHSDDKIDKEELAETKEAVENERRKNAEKRAKRKKKVDKQTKAEDPPGSNSD